MKKSIFKLIALILVFAMLLPMAVACKKDPPPNDDDDDDNTENGDQTPVVAPFIDAALTGYNSVKVYSPSDDAVKSVNNNAYAQSVMPYAGKTVYKWNPEALPTANIYLPSPTNIVGNRYIEFSIFCESKTDTVFKLCLNENLSAGIEIKIDFTGWQSYRILLDSFTATKPFPAVDRIIFDHISGSRAIPIYFADITATTPVFELKTSDGINTADASHFDAILKAQREYKLGNGTHSENAQYVKQMNTIISSCKTSWDLFKATESGINESDTLFNITVTNAYEPGYGYPYKNGSQIGNFYLNVANMAMGYALNYTGNTYYQNPELLEDIKACLEYGYKFYFGEHIMETGKTYGNWYCWDVTIPEHINTTLIMIQDKLDQSTVSKYLSPHKKLMYWPDGAGSNRVTMAIQVLLASALDRDAYRLATTNRLLEDIFYYQDQFPEGTPILGGDGGVFSDGSFVQHGSVPYTGSYGNGFLGNIVRYCYLLKDSTFGLYFDIADNQYEWIFNNYRPVIFGANLSASLQGRGITTSTEEFAAMETIRSAIIMSTYAPAEYKDRILRFVKTVMATANSSFAQYMPLPFIDMAVGILADNTILPETDYEIAKVFGAMDRIAQHTPDYGIMLALSSTRICKYESINDANETGWYHGDGMIYIYTDGNDYGQWAYNHYACPYLMPGTTVNAGLRVDKPVTPPPYNSDPYAGGVAQGKYAAAGFILGYNKDDYIANGSIPRFESTEAMEITARKSYFMFDNEVVCLGSAINDNSGKAVVTVVENRLWGYRKAVVTPDTLHINGVEVTDPITVDTKLTPEAPCIPETTVDARTMHFTNMGGYVFIGNQNVCYQKASRYPYDTVNNADTEASKDFLEIVIHHGTGDGEVDGKYAYVYLPEATVQETEDYYTAPDISVLLRSDTTHAVLEKKLGVIGCIFFEEFSDAVDVEDDSVAVKSISCETPSAIMISKGENGEYTISASDPTQTFGNIVFEIEIEGVSSVVSTDAGVTASISGNTVKVRIDSANALGAGFSLTVK